MNRKNQVSCKFIFITILNILVGIYFFTGEVMATMPTPEWNLTINASRDNDQAFSVAVDSQDNIIVAGYDRNTTLFNDELWRIMKFNPSGGSMWNHTINISDSKDRAHAVAVDNQDNIIVVGYDTTDPTAFPNLDYQWRIMKLDEDKNLLWENITNINEYQEQPEDVAVDSEDNIIVVGHNPEPTSERSEWKIMKFDEDGNSLWENTTNINPSGHDRAALS